MGQILENVDEAVIAVKELILGFYNIVNMYLEIIPSPFDDIIGVALLVTIALLVAKVIRG